MSYVSEVIDDGPTDRIPLSRHPVMIFLGGKNGPLPHEIDAYVFGNWAAHESVYSSGPQVGWDSDWTITHIPTGRAAYRMINKDDAIRGAQALADSLNAEIWGELGSDTCTNNSRDLRDILRKNGVPI